MRKSVLLLVLLAACSKKSKPASELTGCDRYAEMEVRCGDTNGEGVRTVATEYCEKSQKEPKDMMSKMIALEATCAQTTTECAPYKACIEKAKDEHSPIGP
ncbi:MAG: hypothetical protein IPQ07_25065 [Myxococcales bacterium]|nr:hypothetical protein [Myxococcales bacterium]